MTDSLISLNNFRDVKRRLSKLSATLSCLISRMRRPNLQRIIDVPRRSRSRDTGYAVWGKSIFASVVPIKLKAWLCLATIPTQALSRVWTFQNCIVSYIADLSSTGVLQHLRSIRLVINAFPYGICLLSAGVLLFGLVPQFPACDVLSIILLAIPLSFFLLRRSSRPDMVYRPCTRAILALRRPPIFLSPVFVKSRQWFEGQTARALFFSQGIIVGWQHRTLCSPSLFACLTLPLIPIFCFRTTSEISKRLVLQTLRAAFHGDLLVEGNGRRQAPRWTSNENLRAVISRRLAIPEYTRFAGEMR